MPKKVTKTPENADFQGFFVRKWVNGLLVFIVFKVFVGKDILKKLNQYGRFSKAYALAEKNLEKAMELYGKPSEAVSACTVHHLIKEITDKITDNREMRDEIPVGN